MLAERKPVAPSLLSDPAFSTDPSAHPFAVASHEPWLSSPPAGHPTLKSKTRRKRPAMDDTSDSEPIHIIPPPNSPVNFPDVPQSLRTTTFALPNDRLDTSAVPRLEPHSQSSTAAESSVLSHHELSPATPPTRLPATSKRRITLMTLLKRRSSQQPQSSDSANLKPQRASTWLKSASIRSSDLSRPPPSLPDTKPSFMNIEKQVIPPRPTTLGTSTPATVPTPSTAQLTAKQRITDIISSNRHDNLDRIDELDETNPWGIGFHHGGPYEAAVQAIRGKEKTVFPGHGSYNRGVPLLDDNNYSPPQATGLSLNLSPGQILPRTYQAQHTHPSHPVQNSIPAPPTAVMMRPTAPVQTNPQPRSSRMVPPMQNSATLPRRQSYQATSVTSHNLRSQRQSFNHTPTSQANVHTPSPLSSSTTLPQPQQPQRIPPPAACASITSAQPSPNHKPVEAHHKLQYQATEDPVSPVNLVSIGIGMAMLGDGNEEDDFESQPSRILDGGSLPRPNGLPLSNTVALQKTSQEHTRPEISRIITIPQKDASSSVSYSTRPQGTTLEEILDLPLESPPPYASPLKEVQADLNDFRANMPSQPLFPCSIQELESSVPSNEVASIPVHSQAFTSTQVSSRPPSVQNQPTFRSDVPQWNPPSRNNPERLGFEDGNSVHPSMSSKSSSSHSSGPRRVPKNLVMPTPLAQSNSISLQYQNRPPLAQLPAQRPSRSLTHSAPRPVLASSPSDSMPSAQIFVKTQAQEIHFAPSKAGKLKKRVSLMGTASQVDHPPVVTTVSFAPPIIGFDNSVAQEDGLRHMVTEKLVHKRVLSKRKTNW